MEVADSDPRVPLLSLFSIPLIDWAPMIQHQGLPPPGVLRKVIQIEDGVICWVQLKTNIVHVHINSRDI